MQRSSVDVAREFRGFNHACTGGSTVALIALGGAASLAFAQTSTETAVAQIAAGILARPTTQDVEGALRNIVVSLEAIKEGIDEAGKKRKLAQ
jgi:hypothetical protein